MAIVKMNKFTLLAFESQRVELLKKLQNFAEVEFVDMQDENFLNKNEELAQLNKDNSGSEYVGCEDELSMAKFTLNYLREFVPQKSGLKALKEGKKTLTTKELEEAVKSCDFKAICDKVKEKEDTIAELEHEKAKLQTNIDSMLPWEAFDVPFSELKSMKNPYFLGSLPKQYEESLAEEFGNYYYEIISRDNDDLFMFLLCDKDEKEEVEEKLRGFGFSAFKTELTETPINIIQDSKDSIEKLNSKEFFVKEELAGMEEYANKLELVCEYYENIVIRKEAVNNFLKTENVVVIQGWTPKEENEKLIKAIESVLDDNYNITFEEVKEEEVLDVPVKLKNNEMNKAFESVTQMFSTPRYNEIDPTPLLSIFYIAFFGMMVADMGYGLLLFIGTTIALKKFNLDEEKAKFVKFFRWLSIGIFVFGAIYGAFFGDVGAKYIPRIFDTNKDVMSILVMSIVFGAIQIFFGLGIKAYMLIRDGKPKDAFYDVGAWVITLISAGMVIGSGALGLSSVVKKIFVGLLIFGAVVIILTNGRAEKKKGAQIAQGAYALYGITGYVSDLVSYTRLMAIGLSGGSLAGAFNLIAHMFPGVAFFIFGPLLFIFGHLFNFALSLLSAYVHTCRLQYVEYFGKFYEGGGKAFAPFKSQNKYINLKNEKETV